MNKYSKRNQHYGNIVKKPRGESQGAFYQTKAEYKNVVKHTCKEAETKNRNNNKNKKQKTKCLRITIS